MGVKTQKLPSGHLHVPAGTGWRCSRVGWTPQRPWDSAETDQRQRLPVGGFQHSVWGRGPAPRSPAETESSLGLGAGRASQRQQGSCRMGNDMALKGAALRAILKGIL